MFSKGAVKCPLLLEQDMINSSFDKNMESYMEKAREFQKNIYVCFIDYGKAFDCVDHNKLRRTRKEIGIPDHLTFILRNLYAGQEAIDMELDMEQQTGSK